MVSDIKITVSKVVESINKLKSPVTCIKVEEQHLHHVVTFESDSEFVPWVDEKSSALQVAHRVAAKLGFVERPYTGEGRVFRYFEAR